jgi:hypothetical protein
MRVFVSFHVFYNGNINSEIMLTVRKEINPSLFTIRYTELSTVSGHFFNTDEK